MIQWGCKYRYIYIIYIKTKKKKKVKDNQEPKNDENFGSHGNAQSPQRLYSADFQKIFQ